MRKGHVIVSTNWTKHEQIRFELNDQGTILLDNEGRDMLGFGSHYLNSSKDRLYTHLAVIGDYEASCLTFISPSRVLAGNENHVCHCNTNKSFTTCFSI